MTKDKTPAAAHPVWNPGRARLVPWLLAVCASAQMQAAALYWDTNGTTAGAGGGGTWNSGGAKTFNSNSAGTGTSLFDSTLNDDLFFSAGTDLLNSAYTIMLNNTQSAKSLTFDDGIVTFDSNSTNKIQLYGGGLTAHQTVYFGVEMEIDAAQTWIVDAGKTVHFTQSANKTSRISLLNSLILAGMGTYQISGQLTGSAALTIQNAFAYIDNATTGKNANTLTGMTTVQSGGTLGGVGMLANVTLATGGTLAPGTQGSIAPSTLTATGLTWQAGGVMAMHLNAAGASDTLALGTGSLTKSGTGTFAFDFQGTGVAGKTYTLITGTNLGTSFTVSDFTAQNLAAGLTGSFNYNPASGLTFTTVPIPEGEFALAGLAAGGLALVRRRAARKRAAEAAR